MADSPSVPPSVQAWDDAKANVRYGTVFIAGDALRAEVLRLTEELMAAKNSADFYRDLDNERSGKVRSLRAENLRLREALERITNFGKSVPDAVQLIARAALRVPADPPSHDGHPVKRGTEAMTGMPICLTCNADLTPDELASSEPPREAKRPTEAAMDVATWDRCDDCGELLIGVHIHGGASSEPPEEGK